MSELSHRESAYLDQVAERVIHLVVDGKEDEVRAVLAELFLRATPKEESPRFSPDRPALSFRGIVGELWVNPRTGETPVEVVSKWPGEAELEMKKFISLAECINESVKEHEPFVFAHGKMKSAQELPVSELVDEIGRMVLTQMDGWIRVEEVPSVGLE